MADDRDPKPSGAWDATQWHEVKKTVGSDPASASWSATGSLGSDPTVQKYYGDASLYPKIFEANKDVLKDPNLIRVGQKLRIP